MSDETSAAIADDTKLVAGIIREAMDEGSRAAWGNTDDRTLLTLLALRAEAVRLGLQAGRAAASSDLDAIKREAARKAWEYLAKQLGTRVYVPPAEMLNEACDRYLAETYPAPVPEPPHVMVNGWRVTWDANGRFFVVAARGKQTVRYASAVVLCHVHSKYQTIDADVVRVLALREGRGDDA